MEMMRLIFSLIVACALLGAPFGMGRMMDDSNAHQNMHASHKANDDLVPAHKSSTPHYMVCAACVAAGVPAFLDFDPIVLNATLGDAKPSAFRGAELLPPLPPPRNFILTV
jgi:hypothetical protein